jgi:uncharacterized membrane protein
MTLLILFTVLFGAIHILPVAPSIRSRLQQQLGRGFGPAYGILSLLLLVAIIWAFRTADREVWYDPPSWGRHANYLFSLIGFIFIGIFAFRGSWREKLRFPAAIGFTFLAIGHLLANGDDTTTVFFLGLALSAIAQAVVLSTREKQPAIIRQGHNFLSVLAGIALYGLMAQLHAAIIGVPVFQLG